MKRLLLPLLLAIAPNLFADCVGWSIKIWPQDGSINPNSTIILSNVLHGDTRFKKIKEVNLLIVSDSDTIPLEEIERNSIVLTKEVENLLETIVLRPKRPLVVGHTYKLCLSDIQFMDGSYPDDQEDGEWICQELNKHAVADWVLSPKKIDSNYIHYGCGPERWVLYSYSVNSNMPYYIIAYLKNKNNKSIYKLYDTYQNGRIFIGNFMCGGHFYFEDGFEYEVKFELHASDGKLINKTVFSSCTYPNTETKSTTVDF